MDTIDLAVLAATILLFALGVRTLLTKTEPGDPPPMGCGYGVVAGALLAYQFQEEVGGYVNGLRLWIGVALIIPGLRALIQPRGKSLPVAIVAFLLAIIIAAEPARSVYNRIQGIEEPVSMEDQLAQMKDARQGLDELYKVLGSKQATLKHDIQGLGNSKAEVMGHPEGKAKLAQLQAVLVRRQRIDEQRTTLDQGIEDLSIEIKQLEIAGTVSGFDHLDPKFRDVLREIENTDAEFSGSAIEQYMQQEALSELYEKEFK